MEWPSTLTYRPIVAWPGTHTVRRRLSPFSAPLKRTLEQFQTELREISAKDAVLQIALTESQFRNDGAPRAQAVPSHPGVILSLVTPEGPLSFPCDTFTDWQDNLRAIVLTMERLRAAGRYGVTKHGEQYTGWRAIESGRAMPASTTIKSEDEALAVLRKAAHDPHGQYLVGDQLVRRAKRLAHPDTGGSAEEFQRVTDAVAFLTARGRV